MQKQSIRRSWENFVEQNLQIKIFGVQRFGSTLHFSFKTFMLNDFTK